MAGNADERAGHNDIARRSLIAGAIGAAASAPAWSQAVRSDANPIPIAGDGSDSIRRFGAVGDGKSALADQAAFARAIAAVARSGRYVAGIGASYWAHPQDGLFVPAGVYDVGDLDLAGNNSPFPALSLWAVPGSVVIRIPDGQYLFHTDKRLNGLFISGITFAGGRGVLQHRFQGVNVNGRFVFDRCVFDNYTECAIGNNAQDHPYLEVRGCTFMAAEKSRAIGISWGGYADNTIIEGNAFLRNRYHLKLGPNPSGNIHISRNDFLRWDRTTLFDAAIWIVPETTPGRFGSNAGWATIISGNKFGNENMSPGDVRVLVAREGAGDTRQTRAHLERFDPGGRDGAFLAGITIENNRVSAIENTASSFMRSWISEILNLAYVNNRHDGGLHHYLCEFMGPRVGDYSTMTWTVRLENAGSVLGSTPFSMGVSNALIGPQWDPGTTEAMGEETILMGAGGDDTSFVLLATADRPDAFAAMRNDTTVSPAADHAGHRRAVEIGSVAPRGGLAGGLTGATAERQGWLAVDLRRAEPGGTSAIEVSIFNHETGAIARRLRYVLPDEWRRVRLPFTLPPSPRVGAWQYRIMAADADAATRFQVARLYVYHGREPRADGHVATLGDGKWDGSHLVMGRTHVWEAGGALYMRVGTPPRSETDGTRLG